MEILQHPCHNQARLLEQKHLAVEGRKQSRSPGSIKQESEAQPACNNTVKFWMFQLPSCCMKANFTFGRQYGLANRIG